MVARDYNGHGTITSSIIGGNPSTNPYKHTLTEVGNMILKTTTKSEITVNFPDIFRLSLDWEVFGVDNPNTWIYLTVKTADDNTEVFTNSNDSILIASGKYDLLVNLDPGQYTIELFQTNSIELTNFTFSTESHRLDFKYNTDEFRGLTNESGIIMLKTLDDAGIGSIEATLD
ncbi:hypothetical protein LCGC14_2723610, partial [marine sediment metagenome]